MPLFTIATSTSYSLCASSSITAAPTYRARLSTSKLSRRLLRSTTVNHT
jgi:hypothetical protein